MRNETFTAYFTDGTKKHFYCKKSEILDYMSVNEYLKLDHIEVLNRASDNVKHRPFTVESDLVPAQSVKIEAMIEYLQMLEDCYEDSNHSDSLLNTLSACHMMVEKLTGKTVQFIRNNEGKMVVTLQE